MTSVTSSPTPGENLPALNSLRLLTVVALAPMESFLSMGCGPLKNEVTVRVTGLVMPLLVRLPSRLTGLSPSKITLVDLKVAVGILVVSRSEERRGGKEGDRGC